jgi:hypothetical protein
MGPLGGEHPERVLASQCNPQLLLLPNCDTNPVADSVPHWVSDAHPHLYANGTANLPAAVS